MIDVMSERRRGLLSIRAFVALLSVYKSAAQQCRVNGVDQFCEPVPADQAFGVTPLTTSTCGSPPENYCYTPIGGNRSCGFTCNSASASTSHPPQHMTDLPMLGTWWQTENDKQFPTLVDIDLPLRGNKSHEISYISLKFRQLRPESMIIFKSTDYGKTYTTAFQFFSYSCQDTYNLQPNVIITSDSQVICKDLATLSTADDVVTFMTTDDRPGNTAGEITSEELRDFVTATGVRIRLTRIQTNSSDVRDLYYGIDSVNVLATCKCNGHASSCVESSTGSLNCDCKHNTEGRNCEACKALFNRKPWGVGTACEMCTCNSHSSACVFNQTVYELSGNLEDGGVCSNCQHNTAGNQCELCAQFFYPNISLLQDHPDICIREFDMSRFMCSC